MAQRGPGARAALVGALLVASGAAALAHEGIWARLWTPFAGAGVATTAAVVAGTLLGLGLGAGWGGRWTDRVRRPGLLFGVAELVGGLLALGVPALATALTAADLDGPLPLTPALRLFVVLLASFLPCVALGVSLPAALRAVEPEPARAAATLRGLYAANTFGAVLGILAATGWGIETLGLSGTAHLAVAVQGAVGLLGLATLRRRHDVSPPVREPPILRGEVPRGLALAAFLSGAAGLLVQIAWVRRLTPALGTTSYAFGTVLGAFLLSVALGVAILGPRGGRPSRGAAALVLAAAALPAALLAPLVGPVARWAGHALEAALEGGAATAVELLRIRLLAAGAILLPSVALGAAGLPWILQAAAPAREVLGRTAGRLLAWNTVGSALAAVAAGVWAVPGLGTAGSLRAAGALYLGAAAAATPRPRLRAGLAGLAALVATLAAVPFPDAAGRDAVGATFDPAWTDPAAAPATFFAEGAVSTVVVRDREGRPELWVDGKIVASASPTDRYHLALLAHLPMLVHPDPRRVAVVALGTGITARAVALHEPEVLDVFELEGEVARAAEGFRAVGGGLPEGARLAIADGRFALLSGDRRYDVITTDPIHPAAAGSAELYTLEHWRLVRDRLAEGGVACQWLPLYELSADDVRLVLRTFSHVFETTVFVAGPDLVLLGTRRPLALDLEALAMRLRGRVGADLERLGLAAPGRLLGLLLADPGRARRIAGPGPMSTDDRPVLEFSSARSQYAGSSTENLALLSFAASPAASLLDAPPADASAFSADVDRSRRLRRAIAHWMEGGDAALARSLSALDTLAAEDPQDGFAEAMRHEVRGRWAHELVGRGAFEEAAAQARLVLESPNADDLQRLVAAAALAAAGRPAEASAAAQDVLARHPSSARARRLAAPSR